jgi:Transglycosylase SLT domain
MTAPPPTIVAPQVPTQPISLAYDPLFAAFGPTLPTAYLRALAAHESDMHADAKGGRGLGLFSVVPIKLQDFNQRHGTHFSLDDLLKPIINVQVAAGFLRDAVITGYTHNHGNVPNLREDWSNTRFVELVTLGWAAGYSERGGVGRVAAFLEQQGRHDLNLDIVLATAIAAGASSRLANPSEARWCRDVAATYQRERVRDHLEGRSTAPPAMPMGPAPIATPTAPHAPK